MNRAWLAALCVAAACAHEPSEPHGRSVVLITLDTTRADALGCFGAAKDVTPNLDALAKESCGYDCARTVTPETLPAHASILTGLYPHRHTVRDNGLSALPASATTLAEMLASRGYATAAFVSASVLDRVFALDQGFATYSQPSREKQVVTSTTYATRPGKQTAAAACEWLASLAPEQPFFAWVHFFDAHRPYRARRDLLDRAGGDPYLASVAMADEAVGQVLAMLRERGRLDDTIVIVVADHGEGLGDHGEDTHATFVYDSTVRVPLLVRHPDGYGAGSHSLDTVSVIDILPTVCEALDIPRPAEVDGESLWSGQLAQDRGVYFEAYYGYLRYAMSPIAGWAVAGLKYIHSPEPELYFTRRDPGERDNVVEGSLGVRMPCIEAIAAVLARPPIAVAADVELDAATRANLHELGYTEAGAARGPLPSPLDASDRPSPHACAAEIASVEKAMQLGARGEIPQALALVDEVLARRPDQPVALEYRGYFLLASGRAAEAATTLERALAVGGERASVYRQLAACELARGDATAAERRLQRALELDSGDVEALRTLRELLIKRGADAEAEQVREKLQRALGY